MIIKIIILIKLMKYNQIKVKIYLIDYQKM